MHFADKISTEPFPGLRVKTFSILTVILLFTVQETTAQISDDFSDGNLTTDPPWHSSSDHFIVNSTGELQLQAPVAGTSWLSTDAVLSAGQTARWELYIKQSFAPSGANFGRFYLMSDRKDLSAPLNGYFLQLGEAGSTDAVVLFRQTGTEAQPICRATNAAIASAFAIRVNVNRDENGHWVLLVDYTGQRNFAIEGSAIDDTHQSSLFTGVVCTYTITNVSRFFFDDFSFTPVDAPDITPPSIDSLEVLTPETIAIYFSEEVDPSSAEDTLSYSMLGTARHPEAVKLRADGRSVLITFSFPLENGQQGAIRVDRIFDLSANMMSSSDVSFVFFQEIATTFRDVIVTELFPDPSPKIGLPASEYAELYNRSANAVQLRDWILSDGATNAALPEYILLPGAYVAVCPSSALAEFRKLGPAISTSNFPTLNNQGDRLVLTDSKGMVIDSVKYFTRWYNDEDKATGGWSLELIDPEKNCAPETNWKASESTSGGTPGSRNSVYASVPDTEGPRLLEVVQLTDSELKLIFNESLSLSSISQADFIFDPNLDVHTATFTGDQSFSEILLQLATGADSATTYKMQVSNIYDCTGKVVEEGFDHLYLNADNVAPRLISVVPTSETSIALTFSERVELESSQTVLHYEVQGIGNPESAVLQQDQKTVTLKYKSAFPNGYRQELEVRGVKDLGGNATGDTITSFVYFKPSPVLFKDILFTEILADPSPSVGLPEVEFVELYNRSANPVDLYKWTFSDANTTVGLGHHILLPGQYLVLSGAASKFPSHLRSLQVNLPSLNNTGDVLMLQDADGRTVDFVAFRPSWYGENEDAKDGGWSLELIDPDNLCAGDRNWTTSESESGGTPGTANSVLASMPDNTGPKLTSVAVVDSLTIQVLFNERLATQLPDREKISIIPQLEISDVRFTDAGLLSLTIKFSRPMEHGISYVVSTSNIYDCSGNAVQIGFSMKDFLLPQDAQPGDIAINEILFNPRPTGVDFIELYNRSQRIIDLHDWSISNVAGAANKAALISADRSVIRPMEYRVFTTNVETLKGEYVIAVEENLRHNDLPQFNDDRGFVVIRDNAGIVIDSLYYSDDMHAPFVQDPEGVSLERISLTSSGAEPSNWTSASSVAGFATPGYLNSNARADVLNDELIVVEPEIIQPAIQPLAFARIRYRFDRAGFVANVKVVDQQGREIRNIATNELLGTEGFFRWDGDMENGTRARIGYYLVWFQIFSDEGIVRTFKKRLAIF